MFFSFCFQIEMNAKMARPNVPPMRIVQILMDLINADALRVSYKTNKAFVQVREHIVRSSVKSAKKKTYSSIFYRFFISK